MFFKKKKPEASRNHGSGEMEPWKRRGRKINILRFYGVDSLSSLFRKADSIDIIHMDKSYELDIKRGMIRYHNLIPVYGPDPCLPEDYFDTKTTFIDAEGICNIEAGFIGFIKKVHMSEENPFLVDGYGCLIP